MKKFFVMTCSFALALVIALVIVFAMAGVYDGVVDAIEAHFSAIDTPEFWKIKKLKNLIISMTGHLKLFGGIATGPFWDRLPPDVQQVLIEEARKAGDVFTKRTEESDNTIITELKARGVDFVGRNEIDIPAFEEAVESMYDQFSRRAQDTVDSVRKSD